MSDLDTARAAQLLGCSAYDALAMCKSGRFPGAERNRAGQFRIPREDVEALLAAGYTPPPSRRLAVVQAQKEAGGLNQGGRPAETGVGGTPVLPDPRPTLAEAAAAEDADLVLPPGRAVVLALLPLTSADPVVVRLRRLAAVTRSLDFRIARVSIEEAA